MRVFQFRRLIMRPAELKGRGKLFRFDTLLWVLLISRESLFHKEIEFMKQEELKNSSLALGLGNTLSF